MFRSRHAVFGVFQWALITAHKIAVKRALDLTRTIIPSRACQRAFVFTHLDARQWADDFARTFILVKSRRGAGDRDNKTNDGGGRQAEHYAFHRINLLQVDPGGHPNSPAD